MKTTTVFSKTLKAYNEGWRIISNYGSTRSGKTYSALQLLFIIAKNSKKPLTISVVSKSLAHLKLGTMRDFDTIIKDQGIILSSVKNIAESKYTIGETTVDFFGADQEDKVFGPQRGILFVNEANFVKSEVITQLLIRTSGTVFIDYNPSSDFWIDDKEYVTRTDIKYIHSTYLENRFLSKAQVMEIESRRSNEPWFRVYGLGLKGRLEGAVYTNWKIGAFADYLPHGYGLDFGFSPDPDVLIKVALDNKRRKIYLHEEFRANTLSSQSLSKKVADIVGDKLIYADGAESRLIEDMNLYGTNVLKSKKGPGSVLSNIRIMQGYEIIVTETSKALIREFETYVWHDKKSGTPVDKNNHGLDAFSYYARMFARPHVSDEDNPLGLVLF